MAPSSHLPYDCFISYARLDHAYAQVLNQRLIAAGFSVWFDTARLIEGCNWYRDIEDACESSRVVLPVLTPRWRVSEWTRYETYGAETIIPVLAEGLWEDVATPPLRSVHARLILLAERAEDEWDRLYAAIRAALAQEVPEKSQRIAALYHRPNSYFVGRERALEEIHEKLFTAPTPRATQGRLQVITALGGVGKTTLAREYIEKFWRCHHQIFWVDCGTLHEGFAAIHDRLRPDPAFAALTVLDKAAWARDEMDRAAGPSRLLVLDDAPDQPSVRSWIPKVGACRTIITSRFTDWTPDEKYPLWLLEPARALLLRRSGRLETALEIAIVDDVAKMLDYLPLALEQAAAYVGEQGPGYSFADYLQLYKANEARLLASWRIDWSTVAYPRSVFLTWRATIDRLSAGACAVLRLCSFLAPAPIPAAMLVKGASIIAKLAERRGQGHVAAGELDVNEWKAELARFSMVRLLEGQLFSIHGLVQAVERHQSGPEAAAAMVGKAVDLVMSWAPLDAWEFENWAPWRIVQPHAELLWEREKSDNSGNPRPNFLLAYGNFLSAQGKYTDAEPVLRESFEAHQRVVHRDTPASANALALLLLMKGSYAEAESLFRYVSHSASDRIGKKSVQIRPIRFIGGLLRPEESLC